jgi:uncharacterized protein YcfJ
MPIVFGTNRIEPGRSPGGDREGSFGGIFDRFFAPSQFYRAAIPVGMRQRAPRPFEVSPKNEAISPLVVQPPRVTTTEVYAQAPRAPAVPPPAQSPAYVIDPDFRPEFIYAEEDSPPEPGGVQWSPMAAVPDFVPFPRRRSVLDTPEQNAYDVFVESANQENQPMAIDWGDVAGNVLGTIAGGLFDPFGMESGVRSLVAGATSGGAPNYSTLTAPTKVTVDTRTGKITACRRRRRRAIITQGDLNRLFQIATLPNNQNVRIALAKAVR